MSFAAVSAGVDAFFGNVCELDLVFNFYKVYAILDEVFLAGEIEETSKHVVLARLDQCKFQAREAGSQGWDGIELVGFWLTHTNLLFPFLLALISSFTLFWRLRMRMRNGSGEARLNTSHPLSFHLFIVCSAAYFPSSLSASCALIPVSNTNPSPRRVGGRVFVIVPL